MMKTMTLLAATLLVAGAPAFAQHGGGGGGHGGGGGGGHAGYSGGGHMGGGGHAFSGGGGGHAFYGGGARGFVGNANNFGVPHTYLAPRASFSGGHVAYAPRASVAAPGVHSFTGGQHFTPRTGFSTAFHGAAAGSRGSVNVTHSGWQGHPGGWTGHPGWNGHPGWYGGAWHGGSSFWAGGVWHGTYWPRVYYGWGFPLFFPVLPAIYATYWWGGIPYYYVNDVYYTYDQGQNGYVVTEPPPVAGQDSSGTDNSQADSGSPDVYAYPQNGQSDEQQSNDRYECHTWSRSQTGYDPTHPNDSQGNAADYRRAMIACLNGRGYSTK